MQILPFRFLLRISITSSSTRFATSSLLIFSSSQFAPVGEEQCNDVGVHVETRAFLADVIRDEQVKPFGAELGRGVFNQIVLSRRQSRQ